MEQWRGSRFAFAFRLSRVRFTVATAAARKLLSNLGRHVSEMKLTTEAKCPACRQQANARCTRAMHLRHRGGSDGGGGGRYAVSRIRAATYHATSLTIHRRTERLWRWSRCRRRRGAGYHVAVAVVRTWAAKCSGRERERERFPFRHAVYTAVAEIVRAMLILARRQFFIGLVRK